jgi:hypothetical protein
VLMPSAISAPGDGQRTVQSRPFVAPIQRAAPRQVFVQPRRVVQERRVMQAKPIVQGSVVRRPLVQRSVVQPKTVVIGRPNQPFAATSKRSITKPVVKTVAVSKPLARKQLPVAAVAKAIAPKSTITPGKALAAAAITAGAATIVASKLGAAPQSQVFQSKLTAPFKSKYVQPGLKLQPVGSVTPPKLVHNPNYLAGLKGLKSGYKPYWFKHGGFRWYRHYYPLLVGGAWYWYWYNYTPEDAPVSVSTYVEADAFACDPDDDDCGELL